MSEPLAVGRYPGIDIDYFEKPYRMYTVNGLKVPSVTTITGFPDKSGALMHYAERVTAEGVRTLAGRDRYKFPVDLGVPEGARAFLLPKSVDDSVLKGDFLFRWTDADKASKEKDGRLIWLKKGLAVLTGTRLMLGHLAMLELDHRSATNRAAGRGLDVHQVWEDWNERKMIPDAGKYEPDRAPYISAMADFIKKHRPECLESEMVVGSAKHGFAGRLDTVVVIATKQGMAMIDVKTAADIHPNSNFPQLIGYEVARRECGLEPSDHQGILRLGSDGTFEVGWSDAKPAHFLSLLNAWRWQQQWAYKGKKR